MAYDQSEHKRLDRKRRQLRRWTVALAVVAVLSFIGLGGMILERLLKGAPGGGLEINTSKLEQKLAWLGAEIRDLDATISRELGLTSTNGVLINDVIQGSPADKAGLERGDVILSAGGTQIEDSFQIQEEMLNYSPGDTLRLVVDKADSGKKIVYLKLGLKPDALKLSDDTNIKKIVDTSGEMPQARLSTPWGISVSALTQDLREQFDIAASEQGVVIVAVVKDSLADSQGLEVGDVIENVNKIRTPNLQSFYQAIGEEEGILMDIYSPGDGRRFFVTFPDEGDSPPQVLLTDFSEETVGGGIIAVASDSDSFDGAVFSRFSTTPYFILYDSRKNEVSIIKNPYAAQVRGMGIAVAQMLIRKDIDSVIVGGIGPQAFDAFYQAEVKVYGPVSGSVRNAIEDYQLNRLPELKEANLGGYGYSASGLVPAGSSPWTEDTEDEEEGGYEGQPSTIPPKGSYSNTQLTAGGDPRVNRTDICICPNCGAQVTHPASTSCSDMVCPICGSRLMNASPGNEESGPVDLQTQIPSTQQLPALDVPTQVRPVSNVSGIFVGGPPTDISSGAVQRTDSSNLWAISSKPDNIPAVVGQATAGVSTQVPVASQVSTCVCPLDGTTVTHPVGVPCAALQCPVCGSRMVSGTTASVQTGGKPDDMPPIQQTYMLVPVTSKPDNVPLLGQGQQTSYVPIAGGPTEGGPNTGGPTSGGPAIDGPSMGGAGGAAQSARSTECVCPMDGTRVTHPIGSVTQLPSMRLKACEC